MLIHTAGENALIIYLGDAPGPDVAARVKALTSAIPGALGEHLIDLIPSYASLLVIYDALTTDH
ncbi:MAG: carboxyltransferase domain-containing protein, partial [Chromatocurvus sp.]